MGQYRGDPTDTARARAKALEERAAGDSVDPYSYGGNWSLQLGTLGSGKHFIEVYVDEVDRVWVFLYSGSRGVAGRRKLLTY